MDLKREKGKKMEKHQPFYDHNHQPTTLTHTHTSKSWRIRISLFFLLENNCTKDETTFLSFEFQISVFFSILIHTLGIPYPPPKEKQSEVAYPISDRVLTVEFVEFSKLVWAQALFTQTDEKIGSYAKIGSIHCSFPLLVGMFIFFDSISNVKKCTTFISKLWIEYILITKKASITNWALHLSFCLDFTRLNNLFLFLSLFCHTFLCHPEALKYRIGQQYVRTYIHFISFHFPRTKSGPVCPIWKFHFFLVVWLKSGPLAIKIFMLFIVGV